MKLTKEEIKETGICSIDHILYDKQKYKKSIDAVLSGDYELYDLVLMSEDYKYFLDHLQTTRSMFSAMKSNYMIDWFYYGISGIDLYNARNIDSESELTPKFIIIDILKEIVKIYNEKIYLLGKEVIIQNYNFDLNMLMKEDLLGNVSFLGVSINELLSIIIYKETNLKYLKKQILLKKIGKF